MTAPDAPLRDRRDAFTRLGLRRSAGEADRALAEAMARNPALAGPVAAWRSELATLPDRLHAGEARVAFVGTVKSGKSTLVDALLGEDLLPRGSGVLTAQVTAVRHGPVPEVRVTWKSLDEVNRDLAFHLAALGHPGSWNLGDATQRDRIRALLGTPSFRTSPQAAPLEALLRGYPTVADRLDRDRRTEEQPAATDLTPWAARDDTALFLAGVAVRVPTPDLPEGLVLLDCQGADAWNAAHARDLENALLDAHALVYVISSRVGLREADFKLVEVLRGYGLLELTRFVLNLDLGEARDPAELRRVEDATRRRLRDLGAGDRIWTFSALQALLEHRLLLDPEAVAPGERRLPEAWDADGPRASGRSRDAFADFRTRLWAEAEDERERLVLLRGRADLRRILVAASRELRAAGVGTPEVSRAGWETDQLEGILAWTEDELGRAAGECRERIARELATSCEGRRAPQRAAWTSRIKAIDPDPTGAWVAAGGDPVSAAAILRARLEAEAAEVLAATEPLRVNAVRNLALEARGELARRGEAAGLELARLLSAAGLRPAPPPDRRVLAREITATRRIPVFRRRLAPESAAPESTARGRLLARLGERIGLGRRAGNAVAEAEAAAQRALLARRLERAWSAHVAEVREACLQPHVDDAAAQVYARLASWVLAQTSSSSGASGGLEGVLEGLDAGAPAGSVPTP